MNTQNEQQLTASVPPVEDRQARRARLREVAGRVAKMTDEQRAALAARVSVMTIEGRALSMHNQCLIALQMPTSTIVGGFRQWIKAGRCVVKGQHGCVIWVPIGTKDKEGEITERTGFVLGTVFDVSQTADLAQREEAA
jgi:N-terminal domain of anti-restriction factor ArdC